MRRRKWLLRFFRRLGYATGGSLLCFLLLDLIFPVDTRVSYAPLIHAADGRVIHAYLTDDEQWRFETRLDEITPELKTALLFKEDRQFFRHPGVNPLAMARAVWNNVTQGRRTSGASTITMQVARMLRRRPRTYRAKVVEMFRALQLELHYSKDEILQLYLNLAPYGGNIQGVKAASLLYFNKSPNQLSLAELTALSIIPNRPNSLTMGRDNARITRERNAWLARYQAAGLFPKENIDDALREPLNATRLPAPRAMPHLARRLRNALPGEREIRSTVDADIQQRAEEITAGYVQSLRLRGVYNAAALITDNQTGAVLAYIGSPDFLDSAHHGQVDGVAARRSPGSTLKPLLYGLCYDAGYCTPGTVVYDVPVNIGGYAPENYDLRFRGKVTIDDALRQSLNIPAIGMLQKLGVQSFAEGLVRSGFRSIYAQRKKLGLSMILGGCTVRLEELVTLFSAFANNGQPRPLSFIRENRRTSNSIQQRSTPTLSNSEALQQQSAPTILSPAAAYFLTRTLSELQRPDLPNAADLAKAAPRIAWKTGTSYGRKDAWAIGYNSRYTIGVWLGNFDGKGVTDLSGATTATPLLFALFNTLPYKPPAMPEAPPDAAFRLVCAETGKLPQTFCTNQVMDWYIPGVSRAEPCDHQHNVWVSADGAISYCTSCLPSTGYRTVAYPNIPPELAAFYNQANIPYQRTPLHNPACSRQFAGNAPRITSLAEGSTYIIVDRGKQQLTLECQGGTDVARVYWYINDRFEGSAAPGEKLFFYPDAPEIKVSCTDDKGRVSELRIKVRFM